VYQVYPEWDKSASVLPNNVAIWSKAFPWLRNEIGLLSQSSVIQHRYSVVRCPRWSKGRVAITGDAAHGLPPALGQGVGLVLMNARAFHRARGQAPSRGRAGCVGVSGSVHRRQRPAMGAAIRFFDTVLARATLVLTAGNHLGVSLHSLARPPDADCRSRIEARPEGIVDRFVPVARARLMGPRNARALKIACCSGVMPIPRSAIARSIQSGPLVSFRARSATHRMLRAPIAWLPVWRQPPRPGSSLRALVVCPTNQEQASEQGPVPSGRGHRAVRYGGVQATVWGRALAITRASEFLWRVNCTVARRNSCSARTKRAKQKAGAFAKARPRRPGKKTDINKWLIIPFCPIYRKSPGRLQTGRPPVSTVATWLTARPAIRLHDRSAWTN
jgi:hypothetical protein